MQATAGRPGGAGSEAVLVANGPPLDYSFKELRHCAELETEEPRSGKKQVPPDLAKDAGATGAPGAPGTPTPEEGEAAAQGGAPLAATAGAAAGPGMLGASMGANMGASMGASMGAPGAGATAASGVVAIRGPNSYTGKPIKKVLRTMTTAIKMNNNMLETTQGLSQALEFVMPSPLTNLQWIDLSFNQISTIESELLRFLGLKALYMHGNCIKSLTSVDRLKKLPKLLSLTLNGNPIESSKVYRTYVIGALPQIRSLDHSTITQDEVSNSAAWYKGHQERAKKRAEDRQFAAAADE